MAGAPWREPTRSLPLRFGTYEARYSLGLVYIVAGMSIIAGSNTHVVPFLLVGTVAHLGGWFILPARGIRRLWMAWVSLLGTFLLLAGPQWVTVLVLPLLAWLVVRQRPALAFLVLVIPIAVGAALAGTFSTSEGQPVALAIAGAAVVGAGWLARGIAVVRARRRTI